MLLAYALDGNGGFGGNTFHSARSASQWFSLNGASASLEQYQAASGDTTSVAGTPGYVDPGRTLETYLASKGYASDMEGFVARLCQQSRRNWEPALTASAINAYVRAGFATN